MGNGSAQTMYLLFHNPLASEMDALGVALGCSQLVCCIMRLKVWELGDANSIPGSSVCSLISPGQDITPLCLVIPNCKAVVRIMRHTGDGVVQWWEL